MYYLTNLAPECSLRLASPSDMRTGSGQLSSMEISFDTPGSSIVTP